MVQNFFKRLHLKKKILVCNKSHDSNIKKCGVTTFYEIKMSVVIATIDHYPEDSKLCYEKEWIPEKVEPMTKEGSQ
jgi:hypothetical protein